MEREASCPPSQCGPWWRHKPEPKPQPIHDSNKSTVIFNVSGRCFEVLRHIIDSKPSTMLAQMLDDIGTPDDGQPLFVDANPERFAHLLDWYRYGEMFVEGECAIRAVIRDAKFYQLPDRVKINGEFHSICPRLSVAQELAGAARQAVADQWPRFEAYIQRLVDELSRELDAFRRNVDHTFTPEETYCAPSWPTYLYKEHCIARRGDHSWDWVDADLNSDKRLGLVLYHLRRRGLDCSVYWDQDLGLYMRIGVALECDTIPRYHSPTQPIRVILDGLRSYDGRLCVVQSEL